MSDEKRNQAKELSRYATHVSHQEEQAKERLMSALDWLESDIRSIRSGINNGTHVYADNIVSRAASTQDAATKYRLAAEHKVMLDDIAAAAEYEPEALQ